MYTCTVHVKQEQLGELTYIIIDYHDPQTPVYLKVLFLLACQSYTVPSVFFYVTDTYTVQPQ